MKNRSVLYLVAIVLVSLFAFWGCPKQGEMSAVPEETAPPQETVVEEDTPQERSMSAAEALQPVYYDFDRSSIRSDARSALRKNAEWLKANPDEKVKIEGNCDERGSNEYNLALGQRRAASAKKYLVDSGISSRRISLISYGEEKPACRESNEDCWQENRRSDFVGR